MSLFLHTQNKDDAKNVTRTTDGSHTSGFFIRGAGGERVKHDVDGFAYQRGE